MALVLESIYFFKSSISTSQFFSGIKLQNLRLIPRFLQSTLVRGNPGWAMTRVSPGPQRTEIAACMAFVAPKVIMTSSTVNGCSLVEYLLNILEMKIKKLTCLLLLIWLCPILPLQCIDWLHQSLILHALPYILLQEQ